MRRPTKAELSAEIGRLRADHAAACRELRLCREALRRERLARWGIRPLDHQFSAVRATSPGR